MNLHDMNITGLHPHCSDISLLTERGEGVSPRSGQESQMEVNPWMELGTFLVLRFGLSALHLALWNLGWRTQPPCASRHRVFS